MAEIHTMHNTKAGRVFDVCNILFLGGVGAITILPFLYIIAGSFATEAELAQRSFFIFPKTFTLDAYKYVFSTPTFLEAWACPSSSRWLGRLYSCFLPSRWRIRWRNGM